MLFDRKIDFSEDKKEEWDLIRSKIGDGYEVPLPDSERWFHASVDGDTIKIETARHNVRPLVLHENPVITFEEFCTVATTYNDFLHLSVSTMGTTHDVKESTANLKFIFMLIYHLV